MNPYNLCKTWQARNSRNWTRKTASCACAFVAMALLAYPVWRTLAAGGNLDTSFSGDGRYTLPVVYPASNTGYARNVDEALIQTDPNNATVEKVIAAYSYKLAYLAPSASYDFLLTRLHPSGTKDSTFGNNGVAAINFDGTGLPTQNGTVTALALQSNGKILVAGTLWNNGVAVAGLARLTFDGALDTSFSGDGLWFFLGSSEVSDMVVQSADGKILLAGRMLDSAGTYWKSALWRFNTNGTPDGSFGTNGYLHTTIWSGSSTDGGVREGFKSVYVQSDGKIVVLNANGSGYRLRRFTASGAVDSTLQVNAATSDSGNSIRPVGSNIWVIGSTGGSTGQYGAIHATLSGMLHLYRRHQLECEAGRAKDTRNGEFDEYKKGWKRCACPIFASGTLSRKFSRRSTGVSDWNDAKTVVGQLEQSQSWDTPTTAPRPEAPPEPKITLKAAIDSYLRESERHAAVNTVKKYRYLPRFKTTGMRLATHRSNNGRRSMSVISAPRGKSGRRRKRRTSAP